VSEAIAAAAEARPDTPVVAVLMGHEGLPQGRHALHAAGIPAYIFPESAARAIAAQNRYREWRERPPRDLSPRVLDEKTIERILGGARLRGAGRLSELEALELMTAAGLVVAKAKMARSEAEAIAVADEMGWPVVCKVMAEALSHKTEADGVHTGVRDADGVRDAWRRIQQGVARAQPGAQVDGMLIQEQGRDGVELIAGMTREPGFGPLVMFGLGGTLVEVLRDVVFRLAPITEQEAGDMLGSIQGRAILEGPRGAPPADRGALRDLLIRIGQLAEAYPEIAAIDLNPVLGRAEGCLVLDARVSLSAAAPDPEPGREP
jgi:acetyltransferase